MTEKQLEPTWIYDLKTAEGQIIQHPKGDPAPEGYAFSPADCGQEKPAPKKRGRPPKAK